MKVSIITITYNSAGTVADTIRSVLGQDYKNLEYVVVDGGSSDGTLEILKQYNSGISRLVSEKDKGLYDALNKAISLCSGDVVGILHSDDFFINSNVISHYVDTFIRTGAEAVYSDLFYVDRINTDKIFRKWKSGPYKASSFINGWMPPHPTFFVKRELYDKFGLFNTDFRTAADYELMLRFIEKHRIRLAYLPEFTIKMRVGGASNASLIKRLTANREDRKAWKVNGLKPRFYTLYLKPLRKIFQFL